MVSCLKISIINTVYVVMNTLPPKQGTLDLLICRSGTIQGIRIQGGWGHGSGGRRVSRGISRVRYSKQGQKNSEFLP